MAAMVESLVQYTRNILHHITLDYLSYPTMRKDDAVSALLTLWSAFIPKQVHAQVPHLQLYKTTIIGRDIPTFQQEFFGNLPYAEPPVGPLRFAPPVPKFQLFTNSLNGTDYGLSCPQWALSYVTEDCLTLNVLRPYGTTNHSRLPVMVYIHGGGFYEGAAANNNGSYIVAHSVARGTPVIFVNINYRLGAFGFPQGVEAARRGSLNLGLKDQRVALQWLQRNVHLFGGDKSKVTVFGESAGSVAIGELLLSPDFGNLAHGAIMMSGSASSAFIFPGERRENLWQSFVSAVPDCNVTVPGTTFDCLRKANASTIFAASEFVRKIAPEWFPYWPNVDGPGGLIPDLPSKLFKKGHFSRIPFIAGTCLDEGTVFTPPTFNSSTQLRQWIITNSTPSYYTTEIQNQVADKLLDLYPDVPSLGSPHNTGNDTFGLSSQFKRAAAFNGDFGEHAVRRLWMQEAAKAGVRGYGFLFTDPQPQRPGFLGIQHGADLAYAFGTTALYGSPAQNALSRTMMDYYISFSVNQDPNDELGNATRTYWDIYRPSKEVIMSLNSGNLTMIADDFHAKQIDYINSEPAIHILRH